MKIKYKLWWAEAAQIHRQTELIVFLLHQSALPKRKRSGAETAYKPSWSQGSLLFHQEYLSHPVALFSISYIDKAAVP